MVNYESANGDLAVAALFVLYNDLYRYIHVHAWYSYILGRIHDSDRL